MKVPPSPPGPNGHTAREPRTASGQRQKQQSRDALANVREGYSPAVDDTPARSGRDLDKPAPAR